MRSLRDGASGVKPPPVGSNATLINWIIRGTVQLLAGLSAGLTIIAALVAWQLNQGPISLAFLSPYIEDAVNSENRNFRLQMADTILTWAGWERTLDIRILDIKVVGPGGATIGSIPEASFSLSGDALFRGKLAPRSIELFGPKLQFRRTRDGSFDIGFGEGTAQSGEAARRLLSQLISSGRTGNSPAPEAEMSYLNSLNIVGADVTIIDQVLKRSWQVPATDVRLQKDVFGIKGTVSMVIDVEDRQTEIELTGGFWPDQGRIQLAAGFGEVSPVAFASIISELGPLKTFDLPLKGKISVSASVNGNIDSIDFDLTGSHGQLRLPEPILQTVSVEQVTLRGRYKGESGDLDLDELTVDLGADGGIELPGEVYHRMPLRSFQMAGRYDGVLEEFDIHQLDADLQGPKVSVSAKLRGLSSNPETIDIDVRSNVTGIPVDELSRYWPESAGTDAQRWVIAHLSNGTINALYADTRFRWKQGRPLEVVSIDGNMDVDDLSISYLGGMPKIRGVTAHMKFNEEKFDAFITSGISSGLVIRRGKVRLSGLDEFDQYANIDLSIVGSLKSKLAYIDNQPLGFASAVGIDPRSAEGQSTTKLKLRFIIEHNLSPEQIEVSAQSTMRDVALNNVFMGRGIHDSRLSLKVDREGMVVTGGVYIEKIPARLSWRENFAEGADFQSQYDLRATIADVEHIADLGLDLKPFSGDYIRGSVGADVRFTVFDDVDRRIEVRADVTGATMTAPALGWQKDAGIKGHAEITMNLERELVSDVPGFTIEAAGLEVRGSAKYAADGTGLQRIEFEKIIVGRTNVSGALIPIADGSWDVGFHGRSFDLAPMWAQILADSSDSTAEDDFALPDLTMLIEMDKVWLGPEYTVNNFSGTFAHANELWETVMLRGALHSGANFKLDIVPGQDGNRVLNVRSADAGEMFRLLGYYENMRGGELNISGIYDDAAPDRPLRGQVSVEDYRVVDAPVLTHVLSIMALTGIIDALGGEEGLAFSDLEVPFIRRQGAITLTDARATGASLGFTASGTVYTHADVIDMEGTVVPAYALNSALGHIPLFGELLTGGEEGGGIFAANFTMTGTTEEPTVSVNPLSALAPGILRNVFGIFGDAKLNKGAKDDGSNLTETR